MRLPLFLASLAVLVSPLVQADTLTRSQQVDFFRDVPSRNLRGLAVRADGRLLGGPQLSNLEGKVEADILWGLVPSTRSGVWYAGSGGEGRVFELSIDKDFRTYASKELVKLPDSQVLCLCELPDGALVAGTSPRGLLALVREGRIVAQVPLPADSVLDLRLAPDGSLLAATGNPGRIYKIDTKALASAGVRAEKPVPAEELAKAGVTLFGEVRDRNLRRLAFMPDGRVLAGSAPKGNLYLFPAQGGAGQLLLENKEAEVADLLVTAEGGVYAALTFSGGQTELRLSKGSSPVVVAPPQSALAQTGPVQTQPPAPPVGFAASELPIGAGTEKFGGRCQLVYIAPEGLPEVLMSRQALSVYRIARYKDLVLVAGGEQGDLYAYDVVRRMALTLPGSVSSQLSDLLPVSEGRFLVLRNNLPGLSLLDFNENGSRSAETRRIDLGQPASLGLLRSARCLGFPAASLRIQAGVSSGSEDSEGWSLWQELKGVETDGPGNYGWGSPQTSLRGRYVRLKLEFPALASGVEASLDRLQWYFTPQNHRPTLNDFRILSSGFALIPANEPPASPVASLNQIINQANSSADPMVERRRSAFLGSQIVPTPGVQVFLWSLADADGDSLVSTLSLRRDEDADWLVETRDTREPYAQIDVSHLPEGVYHTRLEVSEEAPRPLKDRLKAVFMTDDLVVDRTGPVISEASACIEGERLVLRCKGTDALNLLEGMVVNLNNGADGTVEQSDDGIRDARSESFTLDLPLSKASGATHAEISLYDANGNRTTRIVRWK